MDRTGDPRRRSPLGIETSDQDVDGLISRAEHHPLGLEFLKNGDLQAVSATFETSAFVVDTARQRLTPRR